MPDLDLSTIRSAAEGAHTVWDGPWYAAGGAQLRDMTKADATYIATMDPQTTLALLARLERAEELLRRVVDAKALTGVWLFNARAFLAPSTSEAR